MIGLESVLFQEVLFEAARFVIMLLLLVGGVCIGGKLRQIFDARKAAKKAESEGKEAVSSENAAKITE